MSLKSNVFALQVLQLSGAVTPLIIQPWIARSLGPSEYGRYSYALAVTAYFLLLTDFGFNWSATRALAVSKGDHAKESEIVCSTYAAKALLAGCGLLLLLAAIASGLIRADANLIILAYMSVFGAVLAPVWYFQAMEKPYVTAAIDIALRLSSVPLVLLLVESSEDVAIALAVTTGTQFLIGVTGIAALLVYGSVRWRVPSTTLVLENLRVGFPLFASTSVISLYTTTTSVVVGIVAGKEQLGFFSAAQKLVNATSQFLAPIAQAVYPRISRAFSQNGREGLRLVRLVLVFSVPIGLLISCSLLFFSDWLTIALFGDGYGDAVVIVRLLSPIPLMLSVILVFANLVLIPLGEDGKTLRIVAFAALAHIATVLPLSAIFGAAGAAIAVIIAELVVLLYSAYHGLRLLKMQPSTREFTS